MNEANGILSNLSLLYELVCFYDVSKPDDRRLGMVETKSEIVSKSSEKIRLHLFFNEVDFLKSYHEGLSGGFISISRYAIIKYYKLTIIIVFEVFK